MKITQAEDYGIRCVLYLSRYPKKIVPRWRIARAMNIPEPFLAKIAKDLARAGILEIVRGRKGGYRLRIPPEELSVLQVMEAMSGEMFISPCVLDPDSCQRRPLCPVHETWKELRDLIRDKLENTKFSHLTREEACLLTRRGRRVKSSA